MVVTVAEARHAVSLRGGRGFIRLFRLDIGGRFYDLQVGIFFD